MSQVSIDEARQTGPAIGRGLRRQCPACGTGALYRAYLKTNDACPSCGEVLSHHRADDLPAYLTILLVGHIVVPLMLWYGVDGPWPAWVVVTAGGVTLTGLSLLILPNLKGAVVGLQWALRMHGFGGHED